MKKKQSKQEYWEDFVNDLNLEDFRYLYCVIIDKVISIQMAVENIKEKYNENP